MKRFRFGGVTVEVDAPDGLAMAVVQGQVTPAMVTEIIASEQAWAAVRLAQVISYSEAKIKLTSDELLAAADRAPVCDTPTALVVAPAQFAAFRDYTQVHADRGVMKAAFTTLEAARRWAADQARVRESWGRWRRAIEASP